MGRAPSQTPLHVHITYISVVGLDTRFDESHQHRIENDEISSA